MAEELPEISVSPPEPGNPTGQNEDRYSPFDRPDLVRVNPFTSEVEEICTIIVSGLVFEDWETVWISYPWTEFFSTFKFTCAEREPYPETAPVLQFVPGNLVRIYLGGLLVISGVITHRQVAYEAGSHGVMIQGVSLTWFAARASIVHKDSDFDGKPFLEIAKEVLAPTGVGFNTLGTIDATPFKAGAKPNPGEPIADFLDRLGRDRKIIVSQSPTGRFLFIGEHSLAATADLKEGENIKKMQCIISDLTARSEYITRAQKKANDESSGRDASEQEAKAPGSLKFYSPLVTVIEHPVWTSKEVMLRNDTEVMWRDYLDNIQATITVYGWFRPSLSTTASIAIGLAKAPTKGHALWMAGDEVKVYSPMCPLNQVLKIHTVTWQQSRSAGSETVMLCVNPAGLNSKGRTIPRPQSTASWDPPRTPSPVTFEERFGTWGVGSLSNP